jgi:hypothetical protein
LRTIKQWSDAQPPKLDLVYRLWAQHTVLIFNLSNKFKFGYSLTKRYGSGGGFKIDKLNDNNYHTGKQKIELVLAFRDLDEVVFETPSPDMGSSLEAATLFKKKDAKAKAVIGMTLRDEHLEHVRSAKTAAGMWTVLKNMFQRNSLQNKLTARRRFTL